jgi:two-component system, chemotaxis family, sensor kinase CheA
VGKDDTPSRDAWRSLGLKRDELVVNALRVKRVTRLGSDLLEVAAPVTSEEGELLGTIRYGLSTERMHQALERAKRDSDSRLWHSIVWMVALVTVVTGLGLLLSRAHAVHITAPVTALREAAEALARGDRSVHVDINSGDELSLLGSSFNRMVNELDSSYRELEQMNQTLEQQVGARTVELASRNRDMRLVLDNVDQGLINLSPKGVMAAERSAIVEAWFGEPAGGQFFWEYVQAASPTFGLSFQCAWMQIEEAFLPLQVSLSQLPTQLTVGERSWSFRYLPLLRDGSEEALEGVLLVIAEVTERLAREREEAEYRELMSAFKKLMADRRSFDAFLREGTAFMAHIAASTADVDSVAMKRVLHTLKGNAALMGLTVVARLCQSLETELAEEGHMSPRTTSELCARWRAVTDYVSALLGSEREVIEVPESRYTALLSRLSKDERHSDVLTELESWRLMPASRPLSGLADHAMALAQRLGRGEIDVDVEGADVRLDAQHWEPFFSELVHVVRNAVDHGLEPPSERGALGKPTRGRLALRAFVQRDQLTFEVSDDGRGIDWDAIVARAKSRGLPHETQAQLVEALCTDGVTTCQRPTDVSGRGVGMAAFRQRLESMAGKLEVRSKPGVGTSWLMSFEWPVTRLLQAAS